MKHSTLKSILLSLLIIVMAAIASADSSAFKKRLVPTLPEETLFCHVYFPGSNDSMIELQDGRILNMYGYTSGLDGNLQQSISADGGQTWGESKPVLDSAGSVIPAGPPTLMRLKSGGIGLTTMKKTGNDSSIVYSLWFSRSDDEGKTWSKLTRISEPGINAYPLHNSATVTTSGRIVAPVYWQAGQNYLVPKNAGKCVALVGDKWETLGAHGFENAMDFTWVYFSDDEGKTWQRNTDGSMIVTLDYSAGGHYSCEESVVAEISPDHLLMIHRTPMGRFYQSWSSDDGTTWSQPEPTALAASRTPASLKRIPGTNDLLLVWNQVSAEEIEMGFQRNRLTAAISQDGGLTWKHHRTIRAPEGDQTVKVEVPPIQYYRARRHTNKRQDAYRPYSIYPSLSFWKDRVIITFIASPHGCTQEQRGVCMGLPLSWFYGK